jgi:hypothetical protein
VASRTPWRFPRPGRVEPKTTALVVALDAVWGMAVLPLLSRSLSPRENDGRAAIATHACGPMRRHRVGERGWRRLSCLDEVAVEHLAKSDEQHPLSLLAHRDDHHLHVAVHGFVREGRRGWADDPSAARTPYSRLGCPTTEPSRAGPLVRRVVEKRRVHVCATNGGRDLPNRS